MLIKHKLQLHEVYPLATHLYGHREEKALEAFIKEAGSKPYEIYWFFEKLDEQYPDSDSGFLLEDKEKNEGKRWVCNWICGE